MAETLYEPHAREAEFGKNYARMLVAMHDARATFNFCGGMMFQLCLSGALRQRLARVAEGGDGTKEEQPGVFDASKRQMRDLPRYSKCADADNVTIFHGREVRKVKNAAGGMNFVLHLSDTDNDPEGWSQEELADYNGWGHDRSRPWRDLKRWESEGVQNFGNKFGKEVFGLHHRFYFHFDGRGRLWLSAEDGCEGFASYGL